MSAVSNKFKKYKSPEQRASLDRITEIFFGALGGWPFAKPKNTKTTCLLRQNYRDFCSGLWLHKWARCQTNSKGRKETTTNFKNWKTMKNTGSRKPCFFKSKKAVLPAWELNSSWKMSSHQGKTSFLTKFIAQLLQKGTNWCRNASRPLPLRKQ